MDNVLETYEPEIPQRPTFLTVLCILTFIGSGWGLFSNFFAYQNAEEQSVKMHQSINQNKGDKKGDEISTKLMEGLETTFTPENIRKGAIGAMASAVFCLLGAFMMWKLKRTGYYVYILGALVGIVVPFLIFGTENIIAISMSVITGFFGLLFIVLYGLNLKSLR